MKDRTIAFAIVSFVLLALLAAAFAEIPEGSTFRPPSGPAPAQLTQAPSPEALPAGPEIGYLRLCPPKGSYQWVYVLRVNDGGSLDIAFLHPQRAGLAGIVPPDPGSPEGQQAATVLRAMLSSEGLMRARVVEDRGRLMIDLFDSKGVSVGKRLLYGAHVQPVPVPVPVAPPPVVAPVPAPTLPPAGLPASPPAAPVAPAPPM